MNPTLYRIMIVVTIAVVTYFIRVAPFVFFSRGETPAVISYLGKALPPAVMAMLIVYCLRNTSVLAAPFGLPELIACASVIALHLWRRNNLISILGGTAVYMLCVQVIF